MKRKLLVAALLVASATYGQTDSSTEKIDTISAGNFVIIKKNKNNIDNKEHSVFWGIDSNFNPLRIKKKHANISTNWWILDIGFANVRDNSNYTTAQSMGYLKAVNGKYPDQNSFALNTGKTSNVNIWVFMQKLNISQQVLNLKYGLGLEMYNFRYDHSLSYRNNADPYVFNDTIGFSKNKLYAGYITVPFMININATPHNKNGFSISAGVSAGYLVNAHDKQISSERGKQKYHGELALQPWRFAAITELGIGPVRLYGSYSFNALHKESTGLSQFPYAVGIRFSKW